MRQARAAGAGVIATWVCTAGGKGVPWATAVWMATAVGRGTVGTGGAGGWGRTPAGDTGVEGGADERRGGDVGVGWA